VPEKAPVRPKIGGQSSPYKSGPLGSSGAAFRPPTARVHQGVEKPTRRQAEAIKAGDGTPDQAEATGACKLLNRMEAKPKA